MADSLPIVMDTIKGVLDEHGPLVLANALRKLGWEGRELDKVVEANTLEEIHQHDLFDTQADLKVHAPNWCGTEAANRSLDSLHDYNGEHLTTEEIVHREQMGDASDDEVW